jgi:hypothetical protein
LIGSARFKRGDFNRDSRLLAFLVAMALPRRAIPQERGRTSLTSTREYFGYILEVELSRIRGN